MKILYFRADHRQISVGGSISHSLGIIKALKKHHEVKVVSMLDILSPDLPLRALGLWRSFLETFKVIPYAIRFKPDIIYARYTWWAFPIVFAKWLTRSKLVLEWNGSDYWMQKNWSNHRKAFIIPPFEWFLTRFSTLVVSVSEGTARQLRRKSMVVRNAVDTDLFHPEVQPVCRRVLGIPQGTLVGWVGTFGQWHGLDLLAECVNYDKKVQWVFIGEGKLLEDFKSRVGDNATFLPPMAHHLIPHVLRACDCLVNASIPNLDGTEFFGSPTKLYEYIALGVRVMTTPYGQPGHILPRSNHFTTAKEFHERFRKAKVVSLNWTWDDAVTKILGAL